MEHYFTNNENLKSEFKTIKFNCQNENFIFTSDNGVFSKNKVDYGSHLLIETILINKNEQNLKILDVGCGYGVIGITLSKLLSSHSDLVDVNKRAVHLTTMNIKNNKVDSNAFLSNVYENVTDKYDLIVTNPPIRAGKEVIYNILLKAKEYLNKNGELWFVIRKNQGAKSAIKDLENTYTLEIMKKSNGFFIVKAKID